MPAAVPGREHAERLRQILDDDFGAQFVEIEFFDERRAERSRGVEKEAAAVRRRRLGHDEIGNDFALRRQERAETCYAGRQVQNIRGDKPVKKIPRAVAGDFNDTAVREQGGFHADQVFMGHGLSRHRCNRKADLGTFEFLSESKN